MDQLQSVETIYYLFFKGLISKSRATQQLKQLNAPDYQERLLTLEGQRKEKVEDERIGDNLC